jgi:aminopeptidase
VAAAVTSPPSSGALLEPEQLERYADAVVHACLGLAEGDLLAVHAALAHRELAIALAEAGYRAGARLVEVHYLDPHARAARIRHAADEHLGHVPAWELRRERGLRRPDAASINIMGEADPGVFDGLPAERVAEDHARQAKQLKPFYRGAQAGKRRWVGVAWPTPTWAESVYPELDPLAAQQALARDLLHFCRLGPDDPPGFEGWTRHTDRLVARARALTDLDLRRLEVRTAETALDLRLVPGSRWLGGPRENAWGQITSPNFPTEESFTTPDPAGTEGTFRCSKPLAFRGRVVDGIAGEFRRGRLVRLEADDEEDRDFLAAALATDPGAGRLGEIALVDRSSRIGRAGRIYFNTLLDENAAAHMAFGFGFGQARLPEATGKRVNKSFIHLDVMIGTDELEATGITEAGRRVPLIVDGEWQVP